jgi:hypothetical protein
MRRFRFSLRALMVSIVLLGLAFAGLRSSTPLWANIWFSFSLAMLTLAVPVAVYRHGEQRAFWVGFATFGWVYFIVSLGPWFQTELGFQLATTTLLDLLAPYIVKKDALLRNYVGSFNPPSGPIAPTPWQHWNLPEFPPEHPWRIVGYATLLCPGLYLRIGHAIFCMLIAFLGGEAVRHFAANRAQPATPAR